MARTRRRGRRAVPQPVVRAAGEQVLEAAASAADPGVLVLRIDGQVHSAVDLDDPARLAVDYQDRIRRAVDALLPAGDEVRAVHLGGGGFALPRAFAATRPRIDQEVYERSAAVVRLARDALRLRTGERLRVRTGDARRLLERRAGASAELVVGDVFSGVTTPAHLLTLELAREVARVLVPGGLYVVNVVDEPPHLTARSVAAALREAIGPPAVLGDRRVVGGRASGNLVLVSRLGAPDDGARDGARLEAALAGGASPSAVLAGERTASWIDGAVPPRDPWPSG